MNTVLPENVTKFLDYALTGSLVFTTEQVAVMASESNNVINSDIEEAAKQFKDSVYHTVEPTAANVNEHIKQVRVSHKLILTWLDYQLLQVQAMTQKDATAFHDWRAALHN